MHQSVAELVITWRGQPNERINTLGGESWFDNGTELRGQYASWLRPAFAAVLSATDRLTNELGDQRLSPCDALALMRNWKLSSDQAAEVLGAMPL